MDKAKPFDISKHVVWEAYKRVKANKGAAGIDEESISVFEENLFLHYVFDKWMERNFPKNPWARYADDAVAHCRTKMEARNI